MKKGLKDFSSRRRMYGRMFVLPWEIGFVLFFLIPLGQSLVYAFTRLDKVNFTSTWAGLENFEYIWNIQASYKNNFTLALGDFVSSIPLVVALSLIIAVILNQQFKGRVVFRSIFFLPVIIATGVVMQYIQGDAIAEAMRGGGSMSSSSGVDVTAIMEGMHLPEDITKNLVSWVNDIFNVFWDCGVQIVLFISGLQSIPEQLYEVCRVEGANKWEEFWYVTFPMLSGSTLLVIVFTAIESFTDASNPVMKQALTLLAKTEYNNSAAMLWLYFAAAGAILALTVLLLNKFVFSKWATE